MKYFVNASDEIFAFEEDGSQDHLIQNMTPVSYDVVQQRDAKRQQDVLNALTYAQRRAAEYPPVTDYLDAIVKNDQAQLQKYISDCQAVKAKYPKPQQ
jgi:hypothetical protein